MVIFHSTIYYIDIRTILKILCINWIKHSSIRRIFFTFLFFIAVMPVIILSILFRLLDEILFIGYRKTKIEAPVFIISNPRSGTTLLQTLMASDKDRFTTMALYQTLITSISFYRLVNLIATLEKPIGRPLKRIFDWVSKKSFGGWRGIHPIGLDQPEEDEGFWFMSFLSPAVCLITPFFQYFRYLHILDEMPEGKRRLIGKYYRNFLQRFLYGKKGKRLLVKSVMSTGRICLIKKVFPDARFIFIDRTPLKTIPSYISMMSATWSIHSSDVGVREYQSIGQSAIDFYTHFKKAREKMSEAELHTIAYESLLKDPKNTVKEIYRFLGMELTDGQQLILDQVVSQRRAYKRNHHYDLAMYGYSVEDISDLTGAS